MGPIERLVSFYPGTEAAVLWNFGNVSFSIGSPDVVSIIDGHYPIGYFSCQPALAISSSFEDFAIALIVLIAESNNASIG